MNHQALTLRNPERAAHILADLIGGEVLPLPPLANCWMVLTASDEGLELYPDVLNRFGADFDNPFFGYAAQDHAAIASDLTARTILSLARKAGWPARLIRSAEGDRVAVSVEGRDILTLSCARDGQDRRSVDARRRSGADIRVPTRWIR